MKFPRWIHIYFFEQARQTLKPWKKFLFLLEFLIDLFWSLPKRNSNLLSDWILVQFFKMPNLVNKYKTIFLGKGSLWNFARIFSSCWTYLETCSEVCQKPKSNLLCDWMLVRGWKMQNLLDKYNTKPFFWNREANFWIVPNLSPYNGVL